jgi:hypothetical protein
MSPVRHALPLLLICGMLVAEQERKSNVSTTVNYLEAKFSVLAPRISDTSEFAVQVILTNKSSADLRLNTIFLVPRLVLQVRQITGEPVRSGSLGMPQDDDGEVGRKVLKPGEFVFYKFTGWSYFGSDLAPGRYQVRFIYENRVPGHGDWTGIIETEWLDFEVVKPPLHVRG